MKAKSEEKANKPFYAKWWFWIITVGIICCIANFIYAIYGCDENKSNILTVISGWISGVATFIVGIIAANQSSKYAFFTKKNELLENVKSEQNFFVEHSSKIINIDSYADLILKMVLNDGKNVETDFEILGKYTDCLNTISDFSAHILGFNYCPLSSPDLKKNLDVLYKFILNEFNPDKAPTLKGIAEAESFKKEYREKSKELLKLLANVRSARNQAIIEMQVLRKGIIDCKNIKELQSFESKIYSFLSKKHKDFFSKLENNKEQDNGQVENGK